MTREIQCKNLGRDEVIVLFILCSHVVTMATWRATNTDKMLTNSGQPGEL